MSSRDPFDRKSQDQFVEQLKTLVAANIAGSTQLLARFNDFVRDAAKAFAPFRTGRPADEAAALLARWLDFNLASYSVLSTQSLALLNELMSAAESTLIPKAAPAREAEPVVSPRVELRLSGRYGDRITSGFVVENYFDQPLTVTLECGELIPLTGKVLSSSRVAFDPTTLVIEPRGHATVQVAVAITNEFVVGQTYTATIRLLGFEAKEVGIAITVLPPAEGVEHSAPRGLRSKTEKKGRAEPSR